MSRLRLANALIAAAMLALFLVHGVGSAFQLFGVGSVLPKALGRATLALCAAHAGIGVALTVASVRSVRQKGAAYPVLNARFWAVRVSGIAIAALVAVHVAVFFQPTGAVPARLRPFAEAELVAHLLLALAILVHAACSAEPLLISLGVAPVRPRAADVCLVLAVLVALMAAAFVVYYLRWGVV